MGDKGGPTGGSWGSGPLVGGPPPPLGRAPYGDPTGSTTSARGLGTEPRVRPRALGTRPRRLGTGPGIRPRRLGIRTRVRPGRPRGRPRVGSGNLRTRPRFRLRRLGIST